MKWPCEIKYGCNNHEFFEGKDLTILYAENLDLVGGGDSGGCN